MGIWRDMQEKWKAEMSSQEDAKMKAAKRLSDDDEDEDDDEEEKRCPAGSFADSKVAEFCPEHFLSGKKKKTTMWSVLYYVPEDTTKKSLSSVWRALADVAPAHNKNAAVGAVDCSKHKSFCEKMGMKPKSLPTAVRYAPAETTEAAISAAVPFTGEYVLEDLAAWASDAKAEEQKDEKKKRRRKRNKKEL